MLKLFKRLMQMRFCFPLVIALLASYQAQAMQNSPYQIAFEGICIGSSFDKRKMGQLVELITDTLNGSVNSIPKEQMAITGPDNEEGWIIKTDSETLVVTRGEKKIDHGFTSSSCTVSIRQDDPLKIVSFVETSFRVNKKLDEKQGFNHFWMYHADLIGIANNSAISIQSGNGVIALSLFSLPQR